MVGPTHSTPFVVLGESAGREASELNELLAVRQRLADSFELAAIRRGEYRLVRNSRRKRKLGKRGENIWWSPLFECWVWDFAKLPF